MRRLRFSRWAVVSAVALATASVAIAGASSAATREFHAAGATTTPVPDRPLETAVLDPDSLGGSESDIAYQHLRRTGARFVRIMMNWVSVAPGGAKKPAAFRPRDPGDSMYNWAWTDAQVRGAVSRGFVPFIYVQTAPAWAESDSCGSWGIGSCRPSPRSLADFMSAAARRYGGGFAGLPRVRYWQIWNEPNLLAYLRPQVDGSHRPLSPDFYRLW